MATDPLTGAANSFEHFECQAAARRLNHCNFFRICDDFHAFQKDVATFFENMTISSTRRIANDFTEAVNRHDTILLSQTSSLHSENRYIFEKSCSRGCMLLVIRHIFILRRSDSLLLPCSFRQLTVSRCHRFARKAKGPAMPGPFAIMRTERYKLMSVYS